MFRWPLLACVLFLLLLSSPLQAANDASLRFDMAVQSLEPELLSPNGDGVLDSATATVEFFCRSAAIAAPGQWKERDAIERIYKVDWTLEILREGASDIIAGPSGSHFLSPTSDADWRNGIRSIAISGFDATGAALPSGRYAFRLVGTFIRETTVRLNSKQPPKIQTLVIATSNAALGTIEIDVTPPSLQLGSPQDGLLTNQPAILVSGTVADPNLDGVSINGQDVPVIEGAFSQNVALAEGSNAILVEARDRAGNRSVVSRSVILDTVPPVISDVIPFDDTWTNEPTMLVSAMVTDEHSLSVLIAGEAAELLGGRYQRTLALELEGPIPVELLAMDGAGNVTSLSITINRDITPPVLTVVAPQPELLTNKPSLVVSGAVADPNLASVSVNGIAVSLAGDQFTREITLSEGENTIAVQAADKAGNEASIERLATLDTQPPVISDILPEDGLWTAEDTIEVSAVVTDTHSLIVTIMGEAASLASGRHARTVSLSEEGSISIPIQAEDGAGNSSTATATIRRDVSPPTLSIVPAEGSELSTSTPIISASFADAGSGIDTASFWALLDGVEVTGHFTVTSDSAQWALVAAEALEEGDHALTIQVRDQLGNLANQTVHFTSPASEEPWDDGHEPMILDLALSREYFCPGENPYAPPDHRKVILSFSLSEPSDVAFAVYQPNGSILRLESLGKLDVGEHTAEWDGRSSDGRLMVDGTYELGLSPVDAHGNAGSESRATVVLFY